MRSARQLARNRIYTLTRKRRLIDNGLCTQCGKRLLVVKDKCRECRDRANELQNIQWLTLRKDVLDHYGAPYCACCNDAFEYVFLHLDHVDGGGNKHRRSLSKRGSVHTGKMLYSKLRREGYPLGFQVLCANCNMAKRDNAQCPHQKMRDDLLTKLAAMPMTY